MFDKAPCGVAGKDTEVSEEKSGLVKETRSEAPRLRGSEATFSLLLPVFRSLTQV